MMLPNRTITHRRTVTMTVTIDAPMSVSDRELIEYIEYELGTNGGYISMKNPCHQLSVNGISLMP